MLSRHAIFSAFERQLSTSRIFDRTSFKICAVRVNWRGHERGTFSSVIIVQTRNTRCFGAYFVRCFRIGSSKKIQGEVSTIV